VPSVPADPREILHGLKAVQDDAIEIPLTLPKRRHPEPGFSRVKDLARIVTAACAIRHRLPAF
jgi:hypothetical protein